MRRFVEQALASITRWKMRSASSEEEMDWTTFSTLFASLSVSEKKFAIIS